MIFRYQPLPLDPFFLISPLQKNFMEKKRGEKKRWKKKI